MDPESGGRPVKRGRESMQNSMQKKTISRLAGRTHRSAVRTAAALMLASVTTGIFAVPVHAQESSASLRGNVTANGAAAATQVVAIEVDTGLRRTADVRPDGSYNLPSLRPGTYRLEIATAGGVRRTDEFTLLVGQNAELDFDFSAPVEDPDAVADRDAIIVTGTRLRSMEGGEVGVNITERLIEQLPQNNRNFLAFADLAPGVQFITGANGQSRLQGGAQDSRTINIFIDGIGQKDYVLKNGITGQDSTQGNPFPQSAIGEYRVISSNYKAEFDQVSSVAITAITKSGTNEFHGDMFVDFTNQDLREKTPLERRNRQDKVKTQDLQFGASLGGPIIRDIMHFFAAYEGKRQEVPVEITPGGGRTIESFPSEYQSLFGTLNRTFNEDLYFGKVDFSPTSNDLFEVSVKYRDETSVGLNSGQQAESRATDTKNTEWRGLARWEHTEETWINDLKLAYEDVMWAPTPRLFENGLTFQGGTNRATLLQVGGSPNFQEKGQKGWTVQNDFTYIGLEGHTIKAGVKTKWVKLNTLQLNNTNAQYFFNTGFNPGGGTFNDDIPYRVQFGAATGVSTPIVTSDNFQFGIYLQDDWDVTDRLTLNLGVRWDYEETPAFLDFVHPADAVAAVSPPNYTNLTNANYDINDFISTGEERKPFMGAFQPRIGFSYQIDEEGRFSVFGGYGRSYDRNQFDFLQQEIIQGAYTTRTFNFITGDPLNTCTPSTTCVAWNPIYLTEAGRQQLLAGTPGGRGGGELRFIDNDLKMPYSDQFSLGLRGRFDLLQAEVGYSHIISKDGFAYLLGNRRPDGSFFPPNARPDSPFGFAPPGFGSVLIGTNGLETRADSAYLKLTKAYRPSSPWSLDATYTYTEAEENRAFGEVFSLDYPSLDDYPFARSSGVRKHRFVAAGSVDLPIGVTLSTKVTLASPPYLKGFINQQSAPFERLVLATEGQSNGDRWGLRQVDLAVTKYIPLSFLTDESRLRLRVDIINLFNDRNFVDFNTDPNDTARTAASPTIFGERTGFGIGGNPTRTIKLSAGFSF
jgi:outer membrane receptor protein involved in Fe transport